MNYKYNLKYFNANGMIVPIGYALIIIGVLMFGLAAIDIFWGGFFFGVIFAVAGAIMVVFTTGAKSSDTDMDEQSRKHSDKLDIAAIEKFGIEDRNLKPFQPYQFSNYDFRNTDGLLVKKGGDGKYRSSRYAKTAILFTLDQMHIYEVCFSMIDSEGGDVINTYEFEYEDIEVLDVLTREYKTTIKDKPVTASYELLHFKLADGKEYEFSVHSDSEIDSLITNIFRFKKQKQAANNA